MTTAEVLITEYAGRDNVSPVVEKIAKANEALHDKLEKVHKQLERFEKVREHVKKAQSAVEGFVGAIKNVITVIAGLSIVQGVFGAIGGAIGAAKDKLTDFLKTAVSEAGKIERLRGTFAGLYAGMDNKSKPGSSGPPQPFSGGMNTPTNLYGSVYRGAFDLMTAAERQADATEKVTDLVNTVPVWITRQQIELPGDSAEVVWKKSAPIGMEHHPFYANDGAGGDSSGPLETAKRKMEYVSKFAQNALGEFDDLAEAGTKLEASGLMMERILPSISDLAGAFGASRQNVLELANAFSKLAGGSSGEALEVLREFGITRAALEREGIKFDKGGQLLSDVRNTLEAIERIVQTKFSAISQIMAGTFEQRMSNLGDVWNRLLDRFGQAWLPFIGKITETSQNVLGFLTDSSWVGNLSEKLSGFFEGFFNEKILRVVFTLVSLVERLPEALKWAKTTAEHFIGFLMDGFVRIYNFLGELGDRIRDFLGKGITGAISSLESAVGKMIGKMVGINFTGVLFGIPEAKVKAAAIGAELVSSADAAKKKAEQEPEKSDRFVPIKSPSEVIDRMFGPDFKTFRTDISKRTDALMEDYQKYVKDNQGNGNGVPDRTKFSLFNDGYIPGQTKAEEQLEKIADHTEAMERKLPDISVSRLLWGGGDRSAAGVSLVDLAEERDPHPKNWSTVKVSNGCLQEQTSSRPERTRKCPKRHSPKSRSSLPCA